jgi:hypothetical protein
MRALLAEVVANPQHIRIDRRVFEQVAALIPASIASGWYDAFQEEPEHYKQPLPLPLDDSDLLHYALIEDSQGYLMWQRERDGTVVPVTMYVEGTKHVGGSAITACHIRAIHRGRNILNGGVIANFSMKDVEDHYRDEATGQVTVQLLEERLENFREVGRVLRDEFGGHFLNVLKRADGYLYRGDGQGLVQLLITKFPKSFGDWPAAKLPNVMILRLMNLRRSHRFAAEIDRLLVFNDLENIEVGADYYRPLFFLRVGVFEISDELKQKLRRRELIEPGSQMEQEYRAFTIQAVRDLAPYVGGWPEALPRLADETHAQPFLRCRRCRVGISDEELPCPYRSVCKATHDDHELMDCGWPLVITSEY